MEKNVISTNVAKIQWLHTKWIKWNPYCKSYAKTKQNNTIQHNTIQCSNLNNSKLIIYSNIRTKIIKLGKKTGVDVNDRRSDNGFFGIISKAQMIKINK